MGPGPVWLMAVCILGAGPSEAEVIQTPRHLVTGRGQNVSLSCEHDRSHNTMYWYWQQAGQELQFLIYFQNGAEMDNSGMTIKRFSVEVRDSSSKLSIQRTEPGDSAWYFCASSFSTALGSRPCPIHKPPACAK
uniref:Ig-like domain-containing protein n=1 Tax=Ornithorhynchus anatinus TaxID=9258 RepID=A0A6I8NCS5_ORNAN